MALPAYSEPQTITYTVGDNAYILQVPEMVPVFCLSTTGEFVHVGSKAHAKMQLTETYKIGDKLYIALESTDTFPMYAGYDYTAPPRQLTNAERDAEIKELKAQVAQLNRFMRVVTLSNTSYSMTRKTPGSFPIEYGHSCDTIDSSYIYRHIYISKMHVDSDINDLWRELTVDILKVTKLNVPEISGLDNNAICNMDETIRVKWATQLLYMLESIDKLADLTVLEIGRSKQGLDGYPFNKSYKCMVGYKYFEIISRTKIKTLTLGILCGVVFEVPVGDARAVRLLMKEKGINVIINGSPIND